MKHSAIILCLALLMLCVPKMHYATDQKEIALNAVKSYIDLWKKGQAFIAVDRYWDLSYLATLIDKTEYASLSQDEKMYIQATLKFMMHSVLSQKKIIELLNNSIIGGFKVVISGNNVYEISFKIEIEAGKGEQKKYI